MSTVLTGGCDIFALWLSCQDSPAYKRFCAGGLFMRWFDTSVLLGALAPGNLAVVLSCLRTLLLDRTQQVNLAIADAWLPNRILLIGKGGARQSFAFSSPWVNKLY